MDHLQDQIVMHIKAEWPLSLWEWVRLEAEICTIGDTWHEEHGYAPYCAYLGDHLLEPASTIRLARECNIPTILPAAFYHLSHLSIDTDQHTSDKANREEPGDFSSESLFHGNRTANWSALLCRLHIPAQGKSQARFSTRSTLQHHSNL